jgi:hypothetical protein
MGATQEKSDYGNTYATHCTYPVPYNGEPAL